jgi:predicted metal-dependent hydrolase
MKLKVEYRTIALDSQTVNLKIERAQQRSSTARFDKNGYLNIRLPNFLTPAQEQEHLDILIGKIQKKRPEGLQRRSYKNGDTLQVGTRLFSIDISFQERQTHAARLVPHASVIELRMVETPDWQRVVPTLLSRVIGGAELPRFKRRVHELNHIFFKQEFNTVSFKYNQSNWGSCSSGRNLNFSTRLLFAPEAVQDYVIVHELAHLIELNHSDRFWKLVSDAMPDYEEKEAWLKKYGHLCNF